MPNQQLNPTTLIVEFFINYRRRRVRDTAQVISQANISSSSAVVSTAVPTRETPELVAMVVPMISFRDAPVFPATTQPQPGLTNPIDSAIPLPQVTQLPPSGQSQSTGNDPISSATSPPDADVRIYLKPTMHGHSYIALKLCELLPQTVPPEMKALLKRSYDPNPEDARLHYGMAFRRKDKPRIWVPFPTYYDYVRFNPGFAIPATAIPSAGAYTLLAMTITYNIYNTPRVAEYFSFANRSGFDAGRGHEPSPEVLSDWISLVHAVVKKFAPAILLDAAWPFLCQSKRVLEFNVKFHLIVESYFIANGVDVLKEAAVAVPKPMAPSVFISPYQITPPGGAGTRLAMETPKRPGPGARQRTTNVNDQRREWTCLVCLEEARNCIPFICQHLTMCGDCAVKLESQYKDRMSCPICREKGKWPNQYWTIYSA